MGFGARRKCRLARLFAVGTGNSESRNLKKKNRTPALSPALIAANEAHIIEAGLAADRGCDHQHDPQHINGARAPPAVSLLDKRKVLAIVGVTFPTIWKMMRAGTFPRSRIVGGKSMWRSDEIDAWLAALPVRALKGDYVEAVT